MKSTELNITLKPLSQLRIDKLPFFKKLGNGGFFKNAERPTIHEKIVFCSEYSEVPIEDIEQVSVNSINSLFNAIAQIISSYKNLNPAKSVEVDGREYKFVKEFSLMSGAWWQFVRMTDFEESPITMFSLCYIEKGMKYAQKGTHDIIENPTSNRDEIFQEHLPLDLFLRLNGFFLRKFPEYLTLSTKMMEARRLIAAEKNRNSSNGIGKS